MSEGWLPDEEWEHIQRIIPIVCVDVLVVRYAPTGRIAAVGLILRHTPAGGVGWCLVGGRVRFGESISEAMGRHIHDSLGDNVRFEIAQWPQPLYVAQYCPAQREGFLPDPRKHAIALTYAFELVGEPEPDNEALDFRWFPLDSLPPSGDFGFGQDRVVGECLVRLRART